VINGANKNKKRRIAKNANEKFNLALSFFRNIRHTGNNNINRVTESATSIKLKLTKTKADEKSETSNPKKSIIKRM